MQELRQRINTGEIIDKIIFSRQELKDHDKELVAKVLNRVRKELDGDYNQYRINYILEQIQEEFEDE